MHLKICKKEVEEIGCKKDDWPLQITEYLYQTCGVNLDKQPEPSRDSYLLKYPAAYNLSKDATDEKH